MKDYMKKYTNLFDNLILIFCIALLIRLIYAATLNPYHGDSADSEYYLQVGNNIAMGKGHYHQVTPTERNYASKAPLYPVLIGVVIKIFGHNLFWLRLIQSIAGSITCILVVLIGRELFGAAVGRLAGVIFTFYPFAIYYCGYVGSESIFVVIFSCFIWMLLRLGPGSRKYESAICGFLLGLSTLTRPIPFYLPVFLLIGMLLQYEKKMIKSFTILILVMVMTLIPWWLRNLNATGHLVLTTTEAGYTFFAGNNIEVYEQPSLRGTYWLPENERVDRAKVSEVEADRIYGKKGMSFVKQNPGKFLHLSLYKFIRFWRIYPQAGFSPVISLREQIISLFSYGVLLPFFVLGLVASFKFWKRFIYTYAIILYFCGLSMVLYGSTRLRFPISPLIIIFASSGVFTSLRARRAWQSLCRGVVVK